MSEGFRGNPTDALPPKTTVELEKLGFGLNSTAHVNFEGRNPNEKFEVTAFCLRKKDRRLGVVLDSLTDGKGFAYFPNKSNKDAFGGPLSNYDVEILEEAPVASGEMRSIRTEISWEMRKKVEKEVQKKFDKEVQNIFPLFEKKNGSDILALETELGTTEYYRPGIRSSPHYNYLGTKGGEGAIFISDDLIIKQNWRLLVDHVLRLPSNIHIAGYDQAGEYVGYKIEGGLQTIKDALLELKRRGAKILTPEKELQKTGFKIGDLVAHSRYPGVVFKIIYVDCYPGNLKSSGSLYKLTIHTKNEKRVAIERRGEIEETQYLILPLNEANEVLTRKMFGLF